MANIITKFAKNGVEIEAIWWGLPDWWDNWDVLTRVVSDPIVDKQWPCPDGFHIPTKEEWTQVKVVRDSLKNASGSVPYAQTFSRDFKMPMGGYRTTTGTRSSSDGCFYWSCTNEDGTGAYALELYTYQYLFVSNRVTACGCMIRPFRNIPLTPDAFWNVILKWDDWAWVYYNMSEWLISISGDWETWLTMADKNLWATAVYYDWSSVSDDNCGYLYQWWNNYGFPRTWDISKTSATKVDASTYWPWNYYSSDTFITVNNTPYNWDKSKNTNLWWGNAQPRNSVEWKWIEGLPEWWETGQVLTKVEGWIWWDDITVFPEWWNDWDVLTNVFIWEPIFDTQWPAPEGYHVPTQKEWQAVYDAWRALGQWSSNSWDNLRIELKLPYAGKRTYDKATVSDQGSVGNYRSSSPWQNWFIHSTYVLTFDSSYANAQNTSDRSYWRPIRAFKNSPLVPDTSWTIIYEWSNWAWIYHNPTEWVISVSKDWTTWYTMADKNLGATEVYNDGDELSEANCGYYYQWWNNYGFPWEWDVVKMSGTIDASLYWPWHYYSSNVWITYSSWDKSYNSNLWWWVTQWKHYKSTTEWKEIKALPEWWETGQLLRKTDSWAEWWDETKELPEVWEVWQVLTVAWVWDTQWPAPAGYHVPSKDEWKAVYDAWVALWQWSSGNWNWMRTTLKLPLAGYRYQSNSNVFSQGSLGRYRSSTAKTADASYDLYLSSSIVPQSNDYHANGYSVRCFRNSPLKPSSSWTTIYAWTDWAWIYHNADKWVISISSDWITWYTIADKNLWATAVYNDWDTLSQANCGKYYQWWNNYGFPWTWSVTTNRTQVDASGYWPWNYYSSDKFFIGSNTWTNTQNDNLWWWVTQLKWDIEWKKIEALPEWWEVWQVLTRTEEWASWEDVSIKARWINGFWSWTSEEYSAIAHDADTLYFII